MQMAAGLCAGQVVGLEECALHGDNGAGADKIVVEEPSDGRVACIGKKRIVDLHFDRNAIPLKGNQLRTCFAMKFRPEFVPLFDQRKAEGRRCVVDAERADHEVSPNFYIFERFNAIDLSRFRVTLNIAPNIHKPLEMTGKVTMNDNSARWGADKAALREVINGSGGVVHVSVGKTYMIDRYDLVWSAADIEGDVVLRQGDEGLFTSNRESNEV